MNRSEPITKLGVLAFMSVIAMGTSFLMLFIDTYNPMVSMVPLMISGAIASIVCGVIQEMKQEIQELKQAAHATNADQHE